MHVTLPGYGEMTELRIAAKYYAKVTDYALIKGTTCSDDGNFYGKYWTKDSHSSGGVVYCTPNWDGTNVTYATEEWVGVRPILEGASISNFTKDEDDAHVTFYLEYLQDAAPGLLQQELETAYVANILKSEELPLNDTLADKISTNLNHVVYYYKGKKYVRGIVKPYFKDKELLLSNGETYKENDVVWIEVEPIKWFVFENENKETCLLSRDILFSGVPFSAKEIYDGDFKKTFIKKFMDECFSKDIIRGQTLEENNSLKLVKKF